jgi:hypothetical protein
MIASNAQSTDRAAIEAVQEWKRDRKLSTIGTDEEWREDYTRVGGFGELGIEGVWAKVDGAGTQGVEDTG